MNNPITDFYAQLLTKLRAAGCKPKQAAPTLVTVDGEQVEVRVTPNMRRGTSSFRDLTITVMIGGRYRFRSADRFGTRKAGWDWDRIVKSCLYWAADSRGQREEEKAKWRAEDELEHDPRVEEARRLLPGDWDIDGSSIRLRVTLDAAEALVVAKALSHHRSERLVAESP